MASHSEVVDRFVERGRPIRGSHVYADSQQVYSYGSHFPMAYANDDKKLFVINGDRYGVTTARHQSMVRGAIAGSPYRSVTIPFSIMDYRRADIRVSSINVIDVGKEIEYYRCKACGIDFPNYGNMDNHRIGKDSEDHPYQYVHLLAPSLVTAVDTSGRLCYFLSGFDETGRGFGGGYFLSKLPKKVKTIEEAFASLRPKAVAEDTPFKRQGDIFAVPDETVKTKDLIPVIGKVFIRGNLRPQLLETNHYATEARMKKIGKKAILYARGALYHRPQWREADHRNISLGKIWHRIYQNMALGSWSVDGRVD